MVWFTSHKGNMVAMMDNEIDTICDVSHKLSLLNGRPVDEMFVRLPDEIIALIISSLPLKDRCSFLQTSQHLKELVEDPGNAVIDVPVLNLFEYQVWKKNVHNTAGSRIRSIVLKSADHLDLILKHFMHVNSIKIWFISTPFVSHVLKAVKKRGMKYKCLDVYPYSENAALENIYEDVTDLQAMTLRPHGSDYFWDGLCLNHFPEWNHLDTLILDGVNLSPHVTLPNSITQFEWTNRKEDSFAQFLTKLDILINLQYLQLSHANFTNLKTLRQFLDSVSKLSHLQFLVFRFSKFPGCPFVEEGSENLYPLAGIKVLKFDMCYGDVAHYVNQVLDISNNELKIMSLHFILEDLELSQFYSVVSRLENRKISLQFGLLQKGTSLLKRHAERIRENVASENGDLANNVEGLMVQPIAKTLPPIGMRNVLWKVELSFVDDSELLAGLFNIGVCRQLTEIKLVQCKGINDNLMLSLALSCPRLKKLMIVDCAEVHESGMVHFITEWNLRKSSILTIVWKHKEHPAAFYLQLLHEFKPVLQKLSLTSRFVAKTLPGRNFEGEKILVWEKTESPKLLAIKNYSESELYQYLGFTYSIE